jgi:hypothetical protein
LFFFIVVSYRSRFSAASAPFLGTEAHILSNYAHMWQPSLPWEVVPALPLHLHCALFFTAPAIACGLAVNSIASAKLPRNATCIHYKYPRFFRIKFSFYFSLGRLTPYFFTRYATLQSKFTNFKWQITAFKPS